MRVSHAARQVFDYAEYLALEDESGVRHEFLNGEVWAMAGGSPEHSAIKVNVVASLRAALSGQPCRVFDSDLRVRVLETGLGTYPDASVVCEQLELDPEDRRGHTVTNPKVLVEVLSPSTEAYDRGEKLAHYKRIPSLAEVMLVAHDDTRVDVWRREGEGWTQRSFVPGEQVELRSLGCALPVDEIYANPLARG